MPGYAGWKQLYKEEYQQLLEEGYRLENAVIPERGETKLLPLPGQDVVSLALKDETFWKDAYWHLWETAFENGISGKYPYDEPETLEEIFKKSGEKLFPQPVREEQYRKRLDGALFGRCAGVVLGKPLEMGFDRIKVRQYLESVGQYPLDDYVKGFSDKLQLALRQDCVPSTAGNIAYVQPDDDIHYTILSVLLAEKHGLDFSGNDIGQLWLENIPYHWLWCSARQAYYHFVNLGESNREEQIRKLPTNMNPWRECIDGQIRSDLWGYLFPADPEGAARIAYQDCSFNLTKNGIYGGMFTAGCIASAFSEKPTVKKILEGGLSVIPKESRLAQAVGNVMNWYEREPENWVGICDRIYASYGHLPFAAAINNLAVVTLALLQGNLNYTKSVTTAVMCGLDTDCNAGTVGSIVGAAVGIEGIEDRWTKPLHDTIHSAVAGFGTGKISELADRIEKLHQKFFVDHAVQK